jgi:ribosomal protein S15P/S13E
VNSTRINQEATYYHGHYPADITHRREHHGERPEDAESTLAFPEARERRRRLGLRFLRRDTTAKPETMQEIV